MYVCMYGQNSFLNDISVLLPLLVLGMIQNAREIFLLLFADGIINILNNKVIVCFLKYDSLLFCLRHSYV